MSQKPVTMGIIGYGHFIRTNFIKRLRNCPSIEIAGVYNRGKERRDQAVEDGYWATGDLDELLAREDIESVLIGTANKVHAEHAIKSAEAGKHILCEKPLALTIEEVDQMVEAARKAGVITHVNHGSVYTEGFKKFRALADEFAGQILHFWKRNSRAFGLWSQGARHWAVERPEESGGWTFHHLCHQLNEASIMVGSKPVSVYHAWHKSSPEAPSEEIVNSIIHFENGATAHLADGTSVGNFNDMGLQGTEADLCLRGNTAEVVVPGPEDPTGRPGNRKGTKTTYEVPQGGKKLEAAGEEFAKAVRGIENNLLSFEFIRDQYLVLAAMRKSAETNQVVPIER
jgi:predicted dehydrogenase